MNKNLKTKFSAAELVKQVSQLSNHRVIIVGDVGLDEYVNGVVKRISPEGPIPIVEVESEDYRLGLGSNVAANVSSLGSTPILIGVVGQDDAADRFRHLLNKNECSSDHLITDAQRPTTRKLRVMAGQYHVVRVDFERRHFLKPDVEAKVFEKFKEQLAHADNVILEDYAKGLFSQALIQDLIRESHRAGKKVVLDPNRNTPVGFYSGVDFLTPNTDEALTLAGFNAFEQRKDEVNFEQLGKIILEKTAAKGLVITRGKDGMSAFGQSMPADGKHLPTFARSVFDVTGAGDTAIATFTLALTAGLDIENCCVLANFASGVVVGKLGCASPRPQELVEYIQGSLSN